MRHVLLAVAGSVAAILYGVLGAPASASTQADATETAAIRQVPGELQEKQTGLAGMRSLWSWPEGGRIYTVANIPSGTVSFRDVVAYDPHSLEEVGRLTLPADDAIWMSRQNQFASTGQPHTMAVDRRQGRIFAFSMGPNTTDASWTQAYTSERACPDTGSAAAQRSPCTTGIHVIDGTRMERVKTMRFGAVRVDGVPLYLVPRAISHTPAHGGFGDKVLAVVEDWSTEHGLSSALPVGGLARPRSAGANLVYVVQFDVDRGTRDWMVHLPACQGLRERVGWPQWPRRPHPAAVFRSMSPTSPAIWVGCHSGGSNSGTAVRLPLDAGGMPIGLLPTPSQDAVAQLEPDPASAQTLPASPAGDAAQPQGPEVYVGPELVSEILADPGSDRMVMRTHLRSGDEVWTVFDGQRRDFVGRVGTGQWAVDEGMAGLDPHTGRLYVLHHGIEGGLYVADIRRTPLPQALRFPEFARLHPQISEFDNYPLSIYPSAVPGAPARVFVPERRSTEKIVAFRVLEDALPVSVDAPEDSEGRTLDLEEGPGRTSVELSGAARGYGVRALLVGGAAAAARGPFLDPLGQARGAWNLPHKTEATQKTVQGLGVPTPEQCSSENREIILGYVGPEGPAVVDGDGARAQAVPLQLDGKTLDDTKAPVSRCSPLEWDKLWSAALFGRAPAAEPGGRERLALVPAQCVSGEEGPGPHTGDEVLRGFAARVQCGPDDATGYGYVRGVAIGGVTVGEALSSFRIYRDPVRGIVSRVESVARGVELAGVLRISTVRGVAESWANGRRQPASDQLRPADYDANCDFERTAGTCFQRHLFGVWTPQWSCGPCGDERAFVEGMNRAMGSFGRARLREPDEVLARGLQDGFAAAVKKPEAERFADLSLNNDVLQTTIPVLEIVRYSYPFTPLDTLAYDDRAGRQIYQFAGVEVSSSYGIQCLLVYDPATNTCGPAADPPGSLTIELHDSEGKPLAGGAFEVRQDVDADGLSGLVDTLVANGACVTADDGVGTCSFSTLQPGKYVITQVAAPPGHAPSRDPFPVELVPGEARTVTFVNGSNLARIQVTAKAEDGTALAGASFAAYPDPDADGRPAVDAQPTAACTTGPDGACAMSVPPGVYVLVQTGAPAGLQGIDPVPFAITAAGQVAAVEAVNYPPLPAEAPPASPGPTVRYAPPPVTAPPTLHKVPLPTMGIPEDSVTPPTTAPGRSLTGTVERVVRAPGDAMRLLVRRPMEAVAFAAAMALLAAAWVAVDRRRRLLALTAANVR